MAEEFPTPESPPRGPPVAEPRSRPSSAAGDVRDVDFPMALRGYERAAVDAYVKEVAQLVTELEATQSRDSVVKAALDDVGQHTGEILKKAHEAADEITSRSRTEAEDRLQGAEAEAEILVRDAEDRARQLEADMGELWEERLRLIDDLRRLSDQLLVAADDAGVRLAPPRGEEPTGESEALEPEAIEPQAFEPDEERQQEGPGPPEYDTEISVADPDTVESPAARPDAEEEATGDRSPPRGPDDDGPRSG